VDEMKDREKYSRVKEGKCGVKSMAYGIPGTGTEVA